MRRVCEDRGSIFESEGHGHGLLLNLCKKCNKRRDKSLKERTKLNWPHGIGL